MQLRQLEHVVAVVAAGSFSGAARNLHIAQPTLSRSIAQLETSLGLKLFDRAEAGASPTAAGTFMATRGAEILRSIEVLSDQLLEIARGAHGRLRIGVGPASRIRPLPELIAAVAQHQPGLQIETRQEGGPAIVRGLNDGAYDLVLTFSVNASDYGDLIRHKVFEDRIVAVARPGHPLEKTDRLKMRDLAVSPVAAFRFDSDLRGAEVGLSASEIANLYALQTDEAAIIRQLAIGSGYIGVAPRFIFEDALADGRLVELKLIRPPTYDCWLLVSRRSWAQPLAKPMAEQLRRVLAPRARD